MQVYGELSTKNTINIERIRRLGHIQRLPGQRTIKHVQTGNITEKIRRNKL